MAKKKPKIAPSSGLGGAQDTTITPPPMPKAKKAAKGMKKGKGC